VGTIELPDGRILDFDPENIYFFGHSQGGIVGSILFGIEPKIKGGVISGSGGLLIDTILLRKSPNILNILSAALSIKDKGKITEYFPVLSLFQTGGRSNRSYQLCKADKHFRKY